MAEESVVENNIAGNEIVGNELDLSYEEAFEQLEQVLQELESGDLPLERSLDLYEKGAMLAAYCSQKLDTAELRVRQWQPDETTTPFEDWQEA